MSITTHCMTVNLSISAWTGQRIDKDATRRVTEDAGAASDAARVNKHLVPKESLKAIVAALGAVRTHFYTNTLPWRDNGDRLLTRKRFTTFMQEHERLRQTFDDAVSDFLTTTYPKAREQAAFRMGTMFNPDDYPSTDTLRRRFAVNLEIDAVSEASDFRVQLDEAAQQKVRDDIEAAVNNRLTKAMHDVWSRLSTAVENVAVRLSDEDAIFRDSLIGNLIEVVDLLPDLNITEDPELERLRLEAKNKLTAHTPDALRADKTVRAQVASEAQSLLADLGGIMRAFGNNS
jgi:hypothetical protein